MTTQATRGTAAAGVPDELQGSVPREVRLTGGGIAVAGVAVVLAIGALASVIVMSIVYTRQEEQRRLRAAEGLVLQAQVVDVTVTRGDHPRRLITYRYEVGGRRYTARASVDRNQERHVAEGDLVPVGYLPSSPAGSWMVGHEPTVLPPVVIPLPAIGLLLGAFGVAWAVRRQWTLLSEGRATEARVVAEKKVRRGEHGTYRVTYEFQTLSGATRTVTVESTKKASAVGTIVPVVYHRENPRWAAAYPLGLVRPARAPRRR